MLSEDKIVEKVLEESSNLEKVLNNVFLPEFVKIHRADPKYNHLKLKQEVVANIGIFFTKKKYALWIINKEGKPVLEYDIRGMILRRSNYPKFTKEKIEKLLDMILKEDFIDLNKIKLFIETSEKEAINLCLSGTKDVAGAVNYNKEDSDYKNKVPYQVLAMKAWNDLEYRYFIPGTKGYLFRVLGIDLSKAPEKIIKKINKYQKLKHVVIPFEEEKLPEYYVLDLENQMNFIWRDRVKEIMLALKKDNLNMEKIFE